MSDRNEIPATCARFDDEVDELALGLVDEPARSALLAHAGECDRCGAHLQASAMLADRLLVLAPEIEPPAGFEGRVLARLTGAGEPTSPRWRQLRRDRSAADRSGSGPRRPRIVAAVVAAALLVAAALGAGVGIGRHRSSGGRAAASVVARQGAITTADGRTIGRVQLLSSPRPLVLLTVDAPRPAPGVRSCELELADGRRVDVGSWDYAGIATGVWAAGIDKDLLAAVTMRVRDQDGTVLATASLR